MSSDRCAVPARPSKTNGTVTMRDVAKAVGVSATTVSKALNYKSDISEELRRRVFTKCEELGYRLNSSIQDLARQGRGGLTRNIAFVMVGNAFADPAYARAIDGVSRAAEKHQLHLILDRLHGDETGVYDLPPVLRDGRVDGILVTGTLTAGAMMVLRKLNIPYVVLGAYSPGLIDGAINVRIDVDQRLADLVRALARRDCRRIAYFTENPNNYYERQSIAAFKNAVTDQGLTVDETLIYTGSGPHTGAFPVMESVLAQPGLPFDAIVCLDFRTAQEISHLVLAHGGIGVEPAVMMAVCRPFDYYRLPVPAIYGEASLDEVAFEGVNALMDWLGNRNGRPRQIVLRSAIETVNEHTDQTEYHVREKQLS